METNSSDFIPIADMRLCGNEQKYVREAIESGWISSKGPFVNRFEDAFAQFIGVGHASSCSNGTTALHLAYQACGIKAGDEVLMPNLTFVATANAATYLGAKPVFVDSQDDTWNMDPRQLERKITSRTKAIVPVHLYGVPADLDPILEIAQQHGLKVIEDCAEAHGATYRGKKVGSFGDAAAFSFFGNKIMTSGEGGMVVSNDAQMIQRIGFLKSHGQDPHRPYWHPEVAYNYRLTALQAAFGLAQLEGIDENIARKQKIAKRYEKEFTGIRGVRFQQVPAKGKSVCWIFHFRVTRAAKATRDQLMAALSRARIDSRPVFYPMTELPPYASKEPYPVSHAISSEGIGLPTGANLSNEQQDRVIQTVLDALQ